MPVLPPALAAKLDSLIRRLGSSHDGEVVATVRALERRLRAEKFDLNDLAETVGKQTPATSRLQHKSWRVMCGHCLAYEDQLRPREVQFVTSLTNWRGDLTQKQLAWLTSIYERLQGEAA